MLGTRYDFAVPLTAIPVIVWLATSLGTQLPGWGIVRFLPTWISIPLMVILAGVLGLTGLLMIAMAVPGESKGIRSVSWFYSLMMCLTLLSPTVIAFKLYEWAT